MCIVHVLLEKFVIVVVVAIVVVDAVVVVVVVEYAFLYNELFHWR